MHERKQRGFVWWLTGTLAVLVSLSVGSLLQADQVILDDLIVDGSACIGVDCVNGESFGFDTIRIKENNLRIKAQDTSTSASFPTNDWQITFNESSNGGLNKFSIDDIDGGRIPFTIEAGARTNSLYVDDGGRIGLGTNQPVVELHVVDGDTPTLRLEQNGSSGFTPQTWDVAGNETNVFVRDATNGSRLPFKIRPGAPNNSLVIDPNGNVGINSGTNPSAKLHVSGGELRVNATDAAIRASEFIQNKAAGATLVGLQNTANASTNNEAGFQLRLETSSQTRDAGRITASFTNTTDGSRTSALRFSTNDNGAFAERLRIIGAKIGIGVTSVGGASDIEHSNGATLTTGGAWMNVSSRLAKDDIRELSSAEATAVLDKLQPVRFRYKLEPGEEYVGFVAEDVPDLVATGDRKHLNSMDIVAVVTKVVQRQQRTIDEQRDLVNKQQAVIERLSSKLDELEQKLSD